MWMTTSREVSATKVSEGSAQSSWKWFLRSLCVRIHGAPAPTRTWRRQSKPLEDRELTGFCQTAAFPQQELPNVLKLTNGNPKTFNPCWSGGSWGSPFHTIASGFTNLAALVKMPNGWIPSRFHTNVLPWWTWMWAWDHNSSATRAWRHEESSPIFTHLDSGVCVWQNSCGEWQATRLLGTAWTLPPTSCAGLGGLKSNFLCNFPTSDCPCFAVGLHTCHNFL